MDTAGPTHSSTTVFLQDACLQHKYIRTRDSSHIVERPERLRAVKTGLCAAIARLEETHPVSTSSSEDAISSDTDSLIAAIENLKLEQAQTDTLLPKGHPVQLVRSSAKVDILSDSAVKYIHGDVDGDTYLEKLTEWTRHSIDKISTGQSEIPSELPQGDLYLCPTSLDAIQGALGTVCEAVDTVMKPVEGPSDTPRRAFVAVRPPGHHCGENTPCGFCFVNNVAVGAAHAHLKHGVNRVVILDIDLHHGNGTQSIVWQINEEAYRAKLEADPGAPVKPSLQVYYGSVHDILSFPCEDGKPDLVQAASVSIHGPHGQYIENVHLEPFESEAQFWDVHYNGAYSRLLRKAEDFVKNTGGASSDDTLVFISAGFDASEYETPSMSRHNRKVPTTFFYHFTRDVCAFANKWAKGRIVSVLEGGYSDKALLSGAMAHLTGLVDGESSSGKDDSREPWWSSENVQMLEKLAKKRRGPISALATKDDTPPPWFDRASNLLAILDPRSAESSSSRSAFIPPSSMTLRMRKSNNQGTSTSPTASPDRKKADKNRHTDDVADASLLSESIAEAEPPGVTKKLPRVILKVGPRPEA